MSQRFTVQTGQIYAQRVGIFSRMRVWEVRSVYEQAVPIPHARLVSVDDPLRIKTISCRTLADAAFYEPVPGDARPRARNDHPGFATR